eukprot:jgi/Botrbrau1/10446/Bobra.0133s0053.1
MAEVQREYEYDLVTIGAGSGGTRASRIAASSYKAKVACIEKTFGLVPDEHTGGAGGTCVIRGCVPKKLFVYGASFREDFRDAKQFGWEVPDQHLFDWRDLLKKKDKEIERLNGIYMRLLQNAGVDFIEGRGRVVDKHTVEVDLAAGGKRTLTAKHLLIATGGSAVKAPIEGSEFAITSDDALVLDDLPKEPIVVVGAGYISMEFAGIFNGFGAEVHIMYRKDLPLRGFDDECRKVVAEDQKLRGIHLHPFTAPTKIEKLPEGGYLVHYQANGVSSSMKAGLVMFGTGRDPNTKNLGLENLGLKLDQKGGIAVNEYSETSVPGVYAIGDVTDRMALTPVAIYEAMCFCATVFGGKPTAPTYRNVPTGCFVQPPVSFVGLSEEQAVEELAGPLDIYSSLFRPLKNTLSGREEKTFVKMIVHVPTDRVVGIHMVGPDAPEIMQGMAIALNLKATKANFDGTVGLHPTSAEEFVTMRTPTRRVEGKGTVAVPA